MSKDYRFYSKYFLIILLITVLSACNDIAPTSPVINSFTADMITIIEGDSTTLSWQVTDATSISISPTVGDVSSTQTGTSTVSPTSTTTYTLTATNSAGSTTATVTITVNPVIVEKTITIQPGLEEGKDSYIYSISPDNNDSHSNWLIIGLYQVGYVYRSLLQFDLSSLPENVVIASAQLKLYQYDYISYSLTPQDFTIGVYKINNPWQEEIVTWNIIPGYQDAPESTCPVDVDAVAWLSWDISDLVQEWLDEPSYNYGVLLRDKDEASGNAIIYCRSSDYMENPTLHPKLEITYYML